MNLRHLMQITLCGAFLGALAVVAGAEPAQQPLAAADGDQRSSASGETTAVAGAAVAPVPREIAKRTPQPDEARPSTDPQVPPEPPKLVALRYQGAPDLVEQAGVGGSKTYGHAGVVEIGGSAAFTGASNFTQISINPRVGYFLMDNIEISGILGLNHMSAPNFGNTMISLMVEPSAHVPMTHTMFGFAGLGVGPSYAEEGGLGVTVAPRLGLNFLVGRSGIVTPALHVQYNTQDAATTPMGTVVDTSTSYGLGVDFSILY
jgi:hypothetical protein